MNERIEIAELPLTVDVPTIRRVTALSREHILKLFADKTFPNLGTQRRFVTSRSVLAKFLGEA
jgi:hypothetical protein